LKKCPLEKASDTVSWKNLIEGFAENLQNTLFAPDSDLV
jgi:hypothetical protein